MVSGAVRQGQTLGVFGRSSETVPGSPLSLSVKQAVVVGTKELAQVSESWGPEPFSSYTYHLLCHKLLSQGAHLTAGKIEAE